MDEIEQIKSRIDIVGLISEYLPLKKSGRNFAAVCPFHADTKPSFMVSPDRQIFRCFGCDAKGDIFAFLEKREGLIFPEALEVLAKKAGVRLEKFPRKSRGEKEKILEINNLAAKLYHYYLTKHPVGEKARIYLKKRKISEDSIKNFRLGYAPPISILEKFLLGRGFTIAEVSQAGLLAGGRTGGFFDRLCDRLIFPISDVRGQILGFSGRAIDLPGEQVGEPKYLNTPETAVFQKGNLLYGLNLAKDEIRNKSLAILVEGEFDAVASHQVGVTNVVAVKGTSLTSAQVGLAARFTENLAICFDTDLAGDAAARRGIELADSAGLNIKVIQTPGAKDPDELIAQSADKWRASIDGAIGVYDWLIDSISSKYNSKTSEGKRKIGSELLPILAKISDELVKAHYLQKLASKLTVSEEVLFKAVEKVKGEEKIFAGSSPFLTKPEQADKLTKLLEHFLALILQGADFVTNREGWPKATNLPAGELKKLYQKLIISKLGKLGRDFVLGNFLASLSDDLVGLADNLLLSNLGEITSDKSKFELELKKTRAKLSEVILRRQLAQITSEIKQVSKETEKTRLKLEFNQITNQLAKILA